MPMKYCLYQNKDSSQEEFRYVVHAKSDSMYDDVRTRFIASGASVDELYDNFLEKNGLNNLEGAIITTLHAPIFGIDGSESMPVTGEILKEFRDRLMKLYSIGR